MGTSLVVQWLRIHLSMQRAWVWSLVGELRSHMPQADKAGVLQPRSPTDTTGETPVYHKAAAETWYSQISKYFFNYRETKGWSMWYSDIFQYDILQFQDAEARLKMITPWRIGRFYGAWNIQEEPGASNSIREQRGAAAAAAKSLQSCPTLCDPIDGSPPAPPSLGFSRQEHWSGLPFPSPMHESETWKWSRSVMSNS